jgi:signal transduction histidine kinase
MKHRLWQTISGIFTKHPVPKENGVDLVAPKAEREWRSAIASLEQLLTEHTDTTQPNAQGLILSAPSPVLGNTNLLPHYQTGIFTPDFQGLMPFQLPSANATPATLPPMAEYPILSDDPLGEEQFCLALTPHFSIVMVLGNDSHHQPIFQFSFDPQAIQTAWGRLRSRLVLTYPQHLKQLDQLVQTFTPQPPDYRLVTQFSHLLLQNLPDPQEGNASEVAPSHTTPKAEGHSPEVELLKAFTHEIRTPLTTIRMISRSLLKRKDLPSNVIKRLEVIDQECSEQINRMELIFRAAELKTTPPQPNQSLTAVSLEQVFQQSIPCWKKQAQRRNVELDIVVPEKLPMVVSDPAMLKQMLTGLMEKFTRSLSAGGQIRIQVTTAGNQLKLQVLSRCDHQPTSPFTLNLDSPKTKSIGQLLLFQPDTGSISLNLDVTKNLFQALGGKLIVRQHPEEGEVFTIFLPLEATAEANWKHVECQRIADCRGQIVE